MSRTFISLHDLTADSITSPSALQHNDHTTGVTLDDGTQLHFTSLADMQAFGNKLAGMPIHRRAAA